MVQLLADHPDHDVERLRVLVEAPAGRRRRPEPIRPRSWSEINAAVEVGWITKNEARNLAGLPQRQGPPCKRGGGTRDG